MAGLSSLYPHFLADVPGCPTAIADRAIVDALREFCRRSTILRTIQSFNIVDTVDDHALIAPAGNEVLEVFDVKLGTNRVPLYTEDGPIVEIAAGATGETVIYYTWPSKNVVKVHPIPNQNLSDQLHVEYAYQPLRTTNVIDDEIFDRWDVCIAHKVKEILMMQAGRAWSNPGFAQANRKEWWRLLGDAKAEAFRRFHNPVSAAFYSLDRG